MNPVRVRFAPSPTGYLHLGGLRTALYDFLFARHSGGNFILRIEDTDRSRFVEGAIESLMEALSRLGITIDEGPGIGGDYEPYIQSERLEIYSKEVDRLLETGHAYHCFCSADTLTGMREEQQSKGEFVKYDRRCLKLTTDEVRSRLAAKESHVIRLKMPDDHLFRFDDLIRGHVEMESSQSDDQILIKSDGFPTYHIAAVVDDHYMHISHVIRGEEWLSSTPKHLWLYECLSWEPPLWVHLPLILNPDRSKLSKRMNDVSVDSYLERGYLKEALLNYVALLGWHSADDREIFSLEELCSEFSLERINKAGAVFDVTKLDWMNGLYMRNLPLEIVTQRALPYFEKEMIHVPDSVTLNKIVAAARERCTLLPEIAAYSRKFLSPSALTIEEKAVLGSEKSRTVLNWFLAHLPTSENVEPVELDTIVKTGMTALDIKGKDYYAPLRLALIGQAHGPDLPTIISILGMEKARTLISSALEI